MVVGPTDSTVEIDGLSRPHWVVTKRHLRHKATRTRRALHRRFPGSKGRFLSEHSVSPR
jgi:hypothetical protein